MRAGYAMAGQSPSCSTVVRRAVKRRTPPPTRIEHAAAADFFPTGARSPEDDLATTRSVPTCQRVATEPDDAGDRLTLVLHQRPNSFFIGSHRERSTEQRTWDRRRRSRVCVAKQSRNRGVWYGKRDEIARPQTTFLDVEKLPPKIIVPVKQLAAIV